MSVIEFPRRPVRPIPEARTERRTTLRDRTFTLVEETAR